MSLTEEVEGLVDLLNWLDRNGTLILTEDDSDRIRIKIRSFHSTEPVGWKPKFGKNSSAVVAAAATQVPVPSGQVKIKIYGKSPNPSSAPPAYASVSSVPPTNNFSVATSAPTAPKMIAFSAPPAAPLQSPKVDVVILPKFMRPVSACSLTVESAKALGLHFTSAHNNLVVQRPFNCSKCTKKFKTLQALRLHNARVHIEGQQFLGAAGELQEVLKCSICRSGFSSQTELTIHTRTFHTFEAKANFKPVVDPDPDPEPDPNRPLKCRCCDKTFTNQETEAYHTHVQLHRIKPKNSRHSCSLCELGFFHKDDLRNHKRRVHSQFYTPAPNPNPVPKTRHRYTN